MELPTDKHEKSLAYSGYISSRKGYWWRFAGSAVIATVGVLVLVNIGVGYYEPDFLDPVTATMQSVTIVDAEDPDLKQALEESGIVLPVRQRPEPPQPIVPQREISGFVQIAYTVNPDGTTSNIRVLGAMPRGYYEEQAIAEVARRMHSPGYENGEAVARELEMVIEFNLPADSPRNLEQ